MLGAPWGILLLVGVRRQHWSLRWAAPSHHSPKLGLAQVQLWFLWTLALPNPPQHRSWCLSSHPSSCRKR